MKNINYILIFLVLASCSCEQPQGEVGVIVKAEIIKSIEKAYFEGQRDALTGDIRIERIDSTHWVWSKSCWDSGKQPIFDPTANTERNEIIQTR